MSAAGSVVWHDVECGAYAADLPLWEAIAAEAGDPILELGSGTGRVALHLAERGHALVGIDTDEELVAELNARAERQGVAARASVADATTFELDERFALVIAPMQVVQILGGAEERRAMLSRVAAHLEPGGRFAVAIVTEAHLDGDSASEDGSAPLPDVLEQDGWVYSSLPVAVARVDGDELAIQRLRQVVSPTGELTEEPDTMMLDLLSPRDLAAEAEEAGLRWAGNRDVATSERYIGSTVCLLERR